MSKLKLEQTCPACPEQYDVKDESGKAVGYLRLRHGRFDVYSQTLDFDDPEFSWDKNMEIICTFYPKGDGEFHDDERQIFLDSALECIKISMDKS
jgi:hypothetical protein